MLMVSPLGPLGTGGLLDQRPYKTQEGLMLRAVPAVREESPITMRDV